MKVKVKRIFACAFLFCFLLGSPARAAEVKLGVGSAISSIDPHFHMLTPNMAISQHIFDTLILFDEDLRMKPGLAIKWEALDDKTWEFKLRKGVKFHDGSPFTAEDVEFSIRRVPEVPKSPGRFTMFTRQISGIEIVDDYTIRLKSETIFPLMPNQLTCVFIVSKRASEGKSTADFNSGKAAIGTGPYKFVTYIPGDRVVLERNDSYWGPKEPWTRVTIRLIDNQVTRISTLRAHEVDLIDSISTVAVAELEKNPDISIYKKAGVRNIFLYLDQNRDKSPFVFDNEGNAMDRNPLKDLRVRKAMSKAIDRPSLIDRVMNGQAVASCQLLPKGTMGVCPDLEVENYDPEGAKKLLAEAGYQNGFRLTIHGPNNRYINDEKILQAVAQMWTRVGIKIEVQALPLSVYFGRSAKFEFSVGLLGYGTGSGEPESPMMAVLATIDKQKGWGVFNHGTYSNPKFDDVLREALATIDPQKRELLYRKATKIAFNDFAIIPLHHQVNIWAVRKGLKYNARNDERTMAMELRPIDH